MLRGTADPESLAAGAATLDDFATPAAELTGVTLFQAMFEISVDGRESTLPPGLHPTNPPTVVVQALTAEDSPWGPFSLGQVRVGCRSGLRPRGFVLAAVCDSPVASDQLARRWGFACTTGTVALHRHYDEVVASMSLPGRPEPVLVLRGLDPVPLAPGDVSHSDTLNLAHTPNGLRLVQVETELHIERVERLRPRLETTGAPWPHPDIEVTHPISATVSVGSLAFEPIRFVCRSEVLSFEGTENVGAG